MSFPGGAFVPVLHAATDTRPDEHDTLVAAEAVAQALDRLGFQTQIQRVDLDLGVIKELKARNPYVIFNLVEAMFGDDTLAALVPAVLQHFNLPFTGGSAEVMATTLSKRRTKKLLRSAGIPTPDWSDDGTDCDPGEFYIVKADTLHGSVGMDEGSVVKGHLVCKSIAKQTVKYNTRFFAEKFLDGREFNLALTSDHEGFALLPIQEIVFQQYTSAQPRIVDYAAKWDPASRGYADTVRRYGLESTEPELSDRLASLALSIWSTLELDGYARIDVRTDSKGLPYVLEVNVNPSVAPDAGFVAAAEYAGIGFDGLIKRIVLSSVDRNGWPSSQGAALHA